jgi:tetratricopeptide (TPR) repeat protein
VRPRSGKQGPDWKQLLEIAKATDPDPWRNRLRDTLARGDIKALEALAVTTDVRQTNPESLVLLGSALTRIRADGVFIFVPRVSHRMVSVWDRGAELLRRAQRQYPGDLTLNITYASHCLHSLRQYHEAIRCYTAALALRPNSAPITCNLGLALSNQGMGSAAIGHFTKAIELKPDYVEAFLGRGDAQLQVRQPARALADFSQAIQLGCTWPEAWIKRGNAYAHLNRWHEAIAEYSTVIDKDSHRPRSYGNIVGRNHRGYAYSMEGRWDKAAADLAPEGVQLAWPSSDIWLQLACLRLLQSDIPGYRGLCQQLVERAGQSKQGFTGQTAYMASRTCMMHAQGGTDPAQAVRWAGKAESSDPKCSWYLHVLALAHYRAGQWEKAVEQCQKSLAADPSWQGRALNWLLLGMAQERRNKSTGANKWLEKASQWHADVRAGKRPEASPPDMHLSDWLEFQVLFPEAQALRKEANKRKAIAPKQKDAAGIACKRNGKPEVVDEFVRVRGRHPNSASVETPIPSIHQ